MNISNLEHVVYALLIQVAVWLATRNWWMGAILVTGLFLGREHAQREFNIDGSSRLSPWEALDVWNWTLDSQLDLAFPVAAVLLVAWIARFISR